MPDSSLGRQFSGGPNRFGKQFPKEHQWPNPAPSQSTTDRNRTFGSFSKTARFIAPPFRLPPGFRLQRSWNPALDQCHKKGGVAGKARYATLRSVNAYPFSCATFAVCPRSWPTAFASHHRTSSGQLFALDNCLSKAIYLGSIAHGFRGPSHPSYR